MRTLVVNPNTSEQMTRDIGEEARRYARPGTEIETVCPAWGPRSIEGHDEEALAAVATLETIRERADAFDGVACAVKLLEGIVDYGLATSRVAAYKEPEAKEFSNYGSTRNAVVS